MGNEPGPESSTVALCAAGSAQLAHCPSSQLELLFQGWQFWIQHTSPHLLNLTGARLTTQGSLCSGSRTVLLQRESYQATLEDEIVRRAKRQNPFSETQLGRMLKELLEGLVFLKGLGQSHSKISGKTITLAATAKLLSPGLLLHKENPSRDKAYLSSRPQDSHYPFPGDQAQDTFSLGMCLLHACLLQPLHKLYLPSFDWARLHRTIGFLRPEYPALQHPLKLMLSPTPATPESVLALLFNSQPRRIVPLSLPPTLPPAASLKSTQITCSVDLPAPAQKYLFEQFSKQSLRPSQSFRKQIQINNIHLDQIQVIAPKPDFQSIKPSSPSALFLFESPAAPLPQFRSSTRAESDVCGRTLHPSFLASTDQHHLYSVMQSERHASSTRPREQRPSAFRVESGHSLSCSQYSYSKSKSDRFFTTNPLSHYEGDWREGRYHGRGLLYNKSVEFKDLSIDYRDLTGKDSLWACYEGGFVQGAKEGAGVLHFGNGQSFEGQFENGLPQGEGRFMTRGGQEVRGRWHSGKLIELF